MANEGAAGAINSEAHGSDVRPLVARPANDRSLWIFGGVLLLFAIFLFSALEARRGAVVSEAALPDTASSENLISPPPSLVVPDLAVDDDSVGTLSGPAYAPPSSPAPVMLQPINPVTSAKPSVSVRKTPVYPNPGLSEAPYIPPLVQQTPPVIPPAAPVPAIDLLNAATLAGSRVSATKFLNPSQTVPQGAVIQAVLETALDSNRPGFVRAIVSRDVRSFDGSTVLIPRGSRLFGEYKAELARGQNRAFIQWQTLTRPDGVQIVVNSPAADPLGRAGVKGSVNSHFFERFAGAMLQSTLDIGVGLATRSASKDTVIVGLPGSTQNMQVVSGDTVKPTLKVKHGAMVSVFVARDLDFSEIK